MRYFSSVTTSAARSVAPAPPAADEFNPYYGKYISLVTASDLLANMEAQLRDFSAILSPLSETDADLRYAPDKWSIKELFGHVIDTERIFAYRALRISRNDSTPLPGFEQDDYVRSSPAARSPLAALLEEFGYVRNSNLSLFKNLDQDAWMRRGTASGYTVTVRALAYIIVGHVSHHRNILEQRYFPLLGR